MRVRSFVIALLVIIALHSSPVAADDLEARLREMSKQIDGRVSLYARNLDSGVDVGINADEPVRTASTIKLPIACAVAKFVAEGKHAWSDRLIVRADDKVSGSGVLADFSDGESISLRGTLATTTLRSVMSTRWAVTVTNNEFSAASLPSGGARPSTRPPFAGISRITSHGTVTASDTGACEISGALTLLSFPSCGQFRVAVVCTTGSRGVRTDNTKPSTPATVATHRVIFTSSAASWSLGRRVRVISRFMGAP